MCELFVTQNGHVFFFFFCISNEMKNRTIQKQDEQLGGLPTTATLSTASQ